MGISRQAIHRLIQELNKQGFIKLLPNSQHKRAKLIALTPKGSQAYQMAMEQQKPWAESLGSIHEASDLKNMTYMVRKMIRHLEEERNAFP